MAATVPARAADPEQFEPLLQIPRSGDTTQGAGAGQLENPRGIGTDPKSGHIFIAEFDNARISEFTSWGAFVKAWGWGVADGEAELQTCGPTEPETEPEPSLCQIGLPGDEPGQLAAPLGVAVDSAGNVYVVDVKYQGLGQFIRVQKYSPAGEFLLMFGGDVNQTTGADVCTKADLEAGDECGGGTKGSGDGQFANDSFGNYIAIGPDDTIYVGDVGRIQEFDDNGVFQGEIELGGALAGKTVEQLTMDPSGGFYVVLSGENQVRKLSSSGELLNTLSVFDPGPVAVDLEGNLYVVEDPGGFGSEELEPRVVVFDSAGAVIVGSEADLARPPSTQFGTALYGLATNVLGDEGEAAAKSGDLYVSAYAVAAKKAFVTAFGPEPQFEPAPEVPPTVTAQFALDVEPESATVAAEINPHFFPGTTYYVEYGLGKCSEGGCDQLIPAPPGAPLGAHRDEPAQTAGVALNGLAPGTTYNYRFVAISGSFTTKGLGEGEAGAEASFTTGRGPGLMPDGRVLELVSPQSKNNGELPGGQPGLSVAPLQASPSGDAVTYSSFTAFGPDPESAPAASQYVSRRGLSGWSTQNITPKDEESYLTDPLRGFSSDLSKAAAVVLEPPLTPDAPSGYENLYVMDTGSEALELATDVTPEIDIARLSYCVDFQGASADFSRVFFGSNGSLTPDAPKPPNAESVNLYEWSSATGIRLVSILPNGTPAPPSPLTGFGSGSVCRGTPKGRVFRAISADGTKAFWSAGKNLYARVSGTTTVQLDLKQGGPGPNGGGTFWAASADGSKVFFTDRNKLTSVGTAVTADVGDLYRYDFSKPLGSRLQNLSPSGEALGILGVLGASEDGSAIYFASKAVLASNEGPEGGSAVSGEPNLYLWKEAEGTRFIATLSDTSEPQGGVDLFNWRDEPSKQTARVTPDGDHLAFRSTMPLTGYENIDQETGKADAEAFVYDAAADELICASCRPSGARPNGPSTLPTWNTPYEQRRYLSDDGQRLFFETLDALDVEDTNGLTDVYEFERAGKGSCTSSSSTYSKASDGCVYLISGGESVDASNFLDASTTGDDVFFTTRQQLVPRDQDERIDIYDARVGGFEPPLPPEDEPCVDAAGCRGGSPPPPPPSLQSPATNSPQEGNVKPPARQKCPKGKHRVKKKGKFRCVKNKKKHAGSRKSPSRRASR